MCVMVRVCVRVSVRVRVLVEGGGEGWLYGKVKGLLAISAACEFPHVDSIFTASQGTEQGNSMNKNKPSPKQQETMPGQPGCALGQGTIVNFDP